MKGYSKKIHGIEDPPDYTRLIMEGAIILDVRTNREYSGGHLDGAINIPIDQLGHNLFKMPDRLKPVITCCASGARSESAKQILQSQGYLLVYNGRSWLDLQHAV